MMTEHRWITEQEADRIVEEFEEVVRQLRRRLRGALRSIHEQTEISSGWPERGSGGTPLVVSPVEAQLMHQHKAAAAEQQVSVRLSSVASELNALAEIIEQWYPLPAGLCDGGEPPWGDAMCGRPVETYTRADGTVVPRELCSMHRFRKQRHNRGETP